MKSCKSLIIISAVLVTALPSVSFSDVRVLLKNNRSMLFEGCTDSGDVYTCYKMGGAFEIEKKDVLSLKDVSGMPAEDLTPAAADKGDEKPVPGDGAVPPKDGKDEKAGAEKTGDQKTPVAGTVSNPRLEQITKRKKELAAEREALLRERQEIEADYKKLPDWMPNKKSEEIKKRIADLDEKVKRFNEEATGLIEEEKGLTEVPKKGPEQAPTK